MKKVLLMFVLGIILQAQLLPTVVVIAESIHEQEIEDKEEKADAKTTKVPNDHSEGNLSDTSTDSPTIDEITEELTEDLIPPKPEELLNESQNTVESNLETNPADEIEINNGKVVFSDPTVNIQVAGATLTATLQNEPDARTVVAMIADVIKDNLSITRVVIDGKFGANNAMGAGRSLSEGNVNTIHFKNSNYIPGQLYADATGLFEVTDDGSIKNIAFRALRTSDGFFPKSDLQKIELNAVETILGYSLYAFQGKSLRFPALKVLGGSSYESSANFSEMPYIETIDFPKLESLSGHSLLSEMPNLRNVNLPNLTEINATGIFFDARNLSPMYVSLISLTEFPDATYIGSNNIDAQAPIYMKVNQNFVGDLTGQDRNVLAYSGLNNNPQAIHVDYDDTFKLSAFGDNFYTFGDYISINWYVNGVRSAYTGAEPEIAASTIGVGKFTFKPVVTYNGVEDPDFLQDIEFEVEIEKKQITAEAVPQEIVLGDAFTNKQLQLFVKNVKYGEQVLRPEEYVVEEVSLPSTNLIGEKMAEIKVTHRASGTEAMMEVPITILWGNTIFSKEASADASTGALSLLATEKEPLLVASEGYGATQAQTIVTSRPIFSILSNNYGNKIGNLHFGTVNQSRQELISNWNQRLKEIDMKYGDVVSLTVFRYANAAQNYTGKNTWITKDETPVLETVGFPEALYMITKEGYQLMRVNQLTTNELTFRAGSTTEEIKKRLTDFFNFHNDFSESEKKELSFALISHDETTGTGRKKAQIQVTQTKGDYRFSYNYEVSFLVEPGALELSEIASADFEFGEIKQSSRRQEIAAKGGNAPLITINDYSNILQWDLRVSQTPLIDKDNRELKGAAIALKNLKIVETVHKGLATPSGHLILDQTPYSIGTMVNPNGGNGEENGKSVIQIGEVQNGLLTGVSLMVPANTPMDVTTYRTAITWELVADPTMLGEKQ